MRIDRSFPLWSLYYNWLRRKAIRKQREIKDRMDFELILEAYRFRGYAKGAIKACFCII